MQLNRHQWASIVCICITLLLYGCVNQVALANMMTPPPHSIAQIKMEPIPVIEKVINKPELSAVAAIALDQKAGTVLFEKNSNKIYAPASTTKLMTALVARDA